MKAEDYLKEHRIYDDETIYNSAGDIIGTLSQLMNDYHESEVKELNIPDVVGRSEQLFCRDCKYDKAETYHDKMWCRDCRQKDRFTAK